jgi:hypothetical protein
MSKKAPQCVFCDSLGSEPIMGKQIYRIDHPLAIKSNKNGMIYFHPSCLLKQKQFMEDMV